MNGHFLEKTTAPLKSMGVASITLLMTVAFIHPLDDANKALANPLTSLDSVIGIDSITLENDRDLIVTFSGTVKDHILGSSNGCTNPEVMNLTGFDDTDWSVTRVGGDGTDFYPTFAVANIEADGCLPEYPPNQDYTFKPSWPEITWLNSSQLRFILGDVNIFGSDDLIISYSGTGVASGNLSAFSYQMPSSDNQSDKSIPAPEVGNNDIDVIGNGNEVRIYFERDLASHGAPSDFSVFVDGREYGVSSSFVQTQPSFLVLGIESPKRIFDYQNIRVEYQHTAGNANIADQEYSTVLTSFAFQRGDHTEVRGTYSYDFGSKPTPTPPSLSSAAVQAAGAEILLTFNEALQGMQGMDAPEDFVVEVNGSAISSTVGDISEGGTELVLTLGTTVASTDTTVVKYTYGVDGTPNDAKDIRDLEGARLADFTETATPLPDDTAPQISSATVSTDGFTLSITFNEPMSALASPVAGFTVNVDGNPMSASNITTGGITANGTTLNLTFTEPIAENTTVTLDYVSVADTVEDAAGNDLASTTNSFSVTNNSEVVPPSGSFSAPAPFDGPVITTDFSGDSFTVGQTVTISGTGLDGISSVRFGDREASVTASESSASFVVPDVEPGQYTLTIESSNGNIGLQQVTVLADESVVIGDESAETKGWTSKLDVNSVKMYAKNIEIGGKYQFFVNGEEVAWVRKNSETDIEGSSLRAALGTDYMVRTVDLMPGKNALEVYIDGTRVWRAAYGR